MDILLYALWLSVISYTMIVNMFTKKVKIGFKNSILNFLSNLFKLILLFKRYPLLVTCGIIAIYILILIFNMLYFSFYGYSEQFSLLSIIHRVSILYPFVKIIIHKIMSFLNNKYKVSVSQTRTTGGLVYTINISSFFSYYGITGLILNNFCLMMPEISFKLLDIILEFLSKNSKSKVYK